MPPITNKSEIQGIYRGVIDVKGNTPAIARFADIDMGTINQLEADYEPFLGDDLDEFSSAARRLEELSNNQLHQIYGTELLNYTAFLDFLELVKGYSRNNEEENRLCSVAYQRGLELINNLFGFVAINAINTVGYYRNVAYSDSIELAHRYQDCLKEEIILYDQILKVLLARVEKEEKLTVTELTLILRALGNFYHYKGKVFDILFTKATSMNASTIDERIADVIGSEHWSSLYTISAKLRTAADKLEGRYGLPESVTISVER
ncbi:hypothetical protein IT417_02715 [bacterium]|nr:hypothetical protein [bacterium]